MWRLKKCPPTRESRSSTKSPTREIAIKNEKTIFRIAINWRLSIWKKIRSNRSVEKMTY